MNILKLGLVLISCYAFDANAGLKQWFGESAKNADTSIDKGLFDKVNADLSVAQDETKFWAKQMEEHALFMSLGFEDKALKEEALKLNKEFIDFEQKFLIDNSAKVIETILPLLKKERELHNKALAAMKVKWIGWLYPSLLKHMRMELDYFVNKLNGVKYSHQEEEKFWSDEAKQKLEAMSHLFDPSEKALVKKADDIISRYFDVSKDKNNFIKSALGSVKAVNKFSTEYEANEFNIESIINHTLLKHEMREGERGQKILESFNK